MAVDWRAGDKQAIARLHQELRPIPYRELARCALKGMRTDGYSDSTDIEEKFRQHVDEHFHPSLVLIPGGDIGLRDWFPLAHQPHLLPPEPFRIDGKKLWSYKAGYEHAKREPYLKDWYGDGGTLRRFDRRMAAYQFEHFCRNYYMSNWPRFCKPPSNDGKWDRPAKEDFAIELPDRKFFVDLKSASFNEGGFDWYKARRIYTDTIYVAGFWDASAEVAVVNGLVPGRWLREIAGYCDGNLFRDGDLMSFEVLSVMLTMADCGMSWHQAWRKLTQKCLQKVT